MTYDHWKTTNPADEFLGDALQLGDRENPNERMSTLYASLFCGAGHIMRIAGELSQRMDDDREASKYQIDTVKRWLKSMADDVAAYGPGERS